MRGHLSPPPLMHSPCCGSWCAGHWAMRRESHPEPTQCTGKQSATSNQQPSISHQQPATSNQQRLVMRRHCRCMAVAQRVDHVSVAHLLPPRHEHAEAAAPRRSMQKSAAFKLLANCWAIGHLHVHVRVHVRVHVHVHVHVRVHVHVHIYVHVPLLQRKSDKEKVLRHEDGLQDPRKSAAPIPLVTHLRSCEDDVFRPVGVTRNDERVADGTCQGEVVPWCGWVGATLACGHHRAA